MMIFIILMMDILFLQKNTILKGVTVVKVTANTALMVTT